MIISWLVIIMAKALEQPIPFYIYIFFLLPIVGFFVALFDGENQEEFFVKWLFDSILFPMLFIKKLKTKLNDRDMRKSS